MLRCQSPMRPTHPCRAPRDNSMPAYPSSKHSSLHRRHCPYRPAGAGRRPAGPAAGGSSHRPACRPACRRTAGSRTPAEAAKASALVHQYDDVHSIHPASGRIPAGTGRTRQSRGYHHRPQTEEGPQAERTWCPCLTTCRCSSPSPTSMTAGKAISRVGASGGVGTRERGPTRPARATWATRGRGWRWTP